MPAWRKCPVMQRDWDDGRSPAELMGDQREVEKPGLADTFAALLLVDEKSVPPELGATTPILRIEASRVLRNRLIASIETCVSKNFAVFCRKKSCSGLRSKSMFRSTPSPPRIHAVCPHPG
jgi:hypothetical protein